MTFELEPTTWALFLLDTSIQGLGLKISEKLKEEGSKGSIDPIQGGKGEAELEYMQVESLCPNLPQKKKQIATPPL